MLQHKNKSMRKLFLIGAIICFLFILILSLPQIGATCTWYPPLGTTTNALVALLQASGLGMVMGGLLVMFWKTPVKTEEDDDDVELEDLSGSDDGQDGENDKVE